MVFEGGWVWLCGECWYCEFAPIDLVDEINEVTIEESVVRPLLTYKSDCLCGCIALFEKY
jgi:hypothetical protein